MERSGRSCVTTHMPPDLKASSSWRRWHEHLDLHDSLFFFLSLSLFSQPQYVWLGHSEHLRESRFDVIIPQPGSPLCHMPDLSTGRRRQLALLLLISLMGWRRRRKKPLASHVTATAWTHNYTGHVYIGARRRVRQVQQICCEWSPLPRCWLVMSLAKWKYI